MGYVFSNLHHDSTWLMAKYEGWFYHIISNPARLIIVHVASADSYVFQLYQNLVVLRGRNLPLGVAHLADSIHYCYLHCSFHLTYPPYIFEIYFSI